MPRRPWRTFRRLLACCWLLGAGLVLAFDAPAFRADVTDETGVLSQAEVATLTARIRDLREQDGIWAAIYITESLQGGTIEDAAASTFARWQLGQRDRNNGVLIVLAPLERQMRIEVGAGLETKITEALSRHIVDDVYTPAFRDQRFADGFLQGFERMAQAMRHEMPDGLASIPPEPVADIDWTVFFERWVAVWVGNLVLPIVLLLVYRRRIANGRMHRKGSAQTLRSAFIVFGFLGFVFGLFVAVFDFAFADDREVLPVLVGANALFDLVFFLPFLLNDGRAASGGARSPVSDDGDWRTRSMSSSWDSSSGSDTSSDSSSGGGSSSGSGASGSY